MCNLGAKPENGNFVDRIFFGDSVASSSPTPAINYQFAIRYAILKLFPVILGRPNSFRFACLLSPSMISPVASMLSPFATPRFFVWIYCPLFVDTTSFLIICMSILHLSSVFVSIRVMLLTQQLFTPELNQL